MRRFFFLCSCDRNYSNNVIISPWSYRSASPLGSNLGNRSHELNEGIAFLRTLSINYKVSESPRFETEPVSCTSGSPKFLNSVAEIAIDTVVFPPLNLFGCLEDFEIERGRCPLRDINAPRPLDSTSSTTATSASRTWASSSRILAPTSAASSSSRCATCIPSSSYPASAKP